MHSSKANSDVPQTSSVPDLYEIDFYAWTQEQAELLYNHEWSQIDIPHLIEEIASSLFA
jgi:hypothetical protein